MNHLNLIWQWLDGKKRNIAHVYWLVVVPSLVVLWPEGSPIAVTKVSAIIGITLSSIGYGHAAFKNQNLKIKNE